MNIASVYELRTRLRAAAIAGTNLLAEDFRLKRAVEEIQPLEAASPVFAKIGSLTRALFVPEQQNKEGTLLDALTLVDALLCTQGEVAVEGEIQPLSLQERGSAVSNAPYSAVKALLDALANSGGGRYSYIKEMHENSPELFEDYRVKPALVRALGASYSELAEDVAGWLKNMDASVLPLLEKGFDPKGKKEMVRRVEVIEAIAGARANDFYLKYLPDAEKEVRQSLIYALRHSTENEELLLSLVKTEKGKTKKMAYFALACQEGGEARRCMEKLTEKSPEDGLAALCVSKAAWALDMVLKGFEDTLRSLDEKIKKGIKPQEELEAVKKDLNTLGGYLEALKGKDSRAVSACCRKVAALADTPGILNLTLYQGTDRGAYYPDKKPLTLKLLLANRVQDYLLLCPDEEMVSLALELYEIYGKSLSGEVFFPAALQAKMISQEDCSEWLQGELSRQLIPGRMSYALNGLRWDEQCRSWVIEAWIYSLPLGNRYRRICKVKQQVRGAFLQIMMNKRGGKGKAGSTYNLEYVLGNCIPSGDTECADEIMEYFYQQAVHESKSIYYYLEQLRKHGFPKCEGIAVQHFRRKGSASMWEIRNILSSLPGSGEAKREEGRALLNLIKSGALGKSAKSLNLEQVEMMVETLA